MLGWYLAALAMLLVPLGLVALLGRKTLRRMFMRRWDVVADAEQITRDAASRH